MDRSKSFLNNSIGTANASTPIKGLQLFIADLRSAPQIDDQEKRIQSEIVKIKQQFELDSKHKGKYSGLNGYQCKKNVAKLAYIYITSNTNKLNEILFGMNEVLILMKSKAYSEKFMSYMILEMLFQHEEVVDKIEDDVIHQLLNDFQSPNDDHVSLALNFLGIVGGLRNNLAKNNELVDEVFNLIRSPTTPLDLRKKASLAFLNLLKTDNTILTNSTQRQDLWVQRILSLLDDSNNYRLMISVLPLITYVATYVDTASSVRLIPQLVQTLYDCIMTTTSKLMSPQASSEFMFANVPNPWLITKIVFLLNILIISDNEFDANLPGAMQASAIDADILGKIRVAVSKVIELSSKEAHYPMEKTVQNTVLFSLINFSSKLDPTGDAIVNSVNTLCTLLVSPEINTRFLTLDSLIKICTINGKVAINAIKTTSNLNLISKLLNYEKDSSMVRKIVDLLYVLTDVDNVKLIVNQLLRYSLKTKINTDTRLKRDIAVKVSVLTEKYATDINWFLDISLKLLSLSSNSISQEELIWERLCQIVVNNPQLHMLACEELVEYLSYENASEAIVKTSAFLLGEYAKLIADKYPIGNLFNLFSDKYFLVSNETRAMILTTIIKLYKYAPELGSVVIKFYQLELNSLDIELQTRSYEYLKIIQISKMSNNLNLLDSLLAPIPPFNSKSNPLMKRLGNLGNNTYAITLPNRFSRSNSTLSNLTTTNSGNNLSKPVPPVSRSRSSTAFSRTLGESVTSGSFGDKSDLVSMDTNTGINSNDNYVKETLSSGWEEGFARMLCFKQGVLYNSSMLKILFRLVPFSSSSTTNLSNIEDPYKITIMLTFINQTDWDINGMNTTIIPNKTQDNPEYIITDKKSLTSSTITPHKRNEQVFSIVIRKPFGYKDSPKLIIRFTCGSSVNKITLKLGISILTTILALPKPNITMTLTDFVTKWRSMNEMNNDTNLQTNELQLIQNKNIQTIKNIFTRIGFTVIEQTSIPNTIFLSTILHTKSEGNFGCLIKIKKNNETETHSNYNITCRTTSTSILSKYLLQTIKYVLSN